MIRSSRIGTAAAPVMTGGMARRRRPTSRQTSPHVIVPGPATLKSPVASATVACSSARGHVVLVHELQPGIEAEHLGDGRHPQHAGEHGGQVVAEHVGEPQRADRHVGVVLGEVARPARRPRAASARPGSSVAGSDGCARGRSRDRRSSSRRPASTSSAPACAPSSPSAAAAARRFIVPITLTSCSRRLLTRVESTSRWVCNTVSTCVARTMRWRMPYDASAFTNSVRRSGRRGSRSSTPTTSSTSGRCSSRCAMRLPQKVPSPVTRMRTGALSRATRCAGSAACRRPRTG